MLTCQSSRVFHWSWIRENSPSFTLSIKPSLCGWNGKGEYFTPTAQRWTEARVRPGSIYNGWMDEAELVSWTVYILAFIVGSHVLFLVVTPFSSY